jgi:hypothetical protein
MGVPTSEVGYTPAMPRREDHEVHKGHVVTLEEKKHTFLSAIFMSLICWIRSGESRTTAGKLGVEGYCNGLRELVADFDIHSIRAFFV